MRSFLLTILLCTSLNVMAQQGDQKVFDLAQRASDRSYDDLLEYVDSKLSKKEDIARFFYYWIGQNITYDVTVDTYELNEAHYAAETQPQFIYEHRKATCLGFTNLYAAFLSYFDINHRSVMGYSRHQSNILKKIKPTLDHVWSAIESDGNWHLVDVTWAFTQIDSPQSRDHYFMTPPEVFANDHLPLDPEWFLDAPYLSLGDFEEQPFINPLYFGMTEKESLTPQIDQNELGETILRIRSIRGWRFSLAAVNQNNRKAKKLKYRIKRAKGVVEFTLKNDHDGLVLRLDADRRFRSGTFITLNGLMFIPHTDWKPADKPNFLQFSTKKERFKK